MNDTEYFNDFYTVKDFIAEHDILTCPIGYDRIRSIFAEAGALVYFVECSHYDSIWRVSVLRQGHFQDESIETKRFIQYFMALAGIRVRREEPFLVRKAARMEITFIHQLNEGGKRITFARMSRGQVVKCREEFELPPGR